MSVISRKCQLNASLINRTFPNADDSANPPLKSGQGWVTTAYWSLLCVQFISVFYSISDKIRGHWRRREITLSVRILVLYLFVSKIFQYRDSGDVDIPNLNHTRAEHSEISNTPVFVDKRMPFYLSISKHNLFSSCHIISKYTKFRVHIPKHNASTYPKNTRQIGNECKY